MENPIIFLFSYHHMNTRKICYAIASKIKAAIFDLSSKTEQFDLEKYDLVGFGAGIDSGKHYPAMIQYAEKLAEVKNKKAFIFSTSGVYLERKMRNDHRTLREILERKGFVIAGEFGCKGYNTNSILKYTGGMNKGSPTDEDIKNAETFAGKLLI